MKGGWWPLLREIVLPALSGKGAREAEGERGGRGQALSGGRHFPETPVDGFLPNGVEWCCLQRCRTGWSLSGLDPATHKGELK